MTASSPSIRGHLSIRLSAYQSNRQDFESLLSGFLDVLNLDLEYRHELVEHESALAELERLTGVDLP